MGIKVKTTDDALQVYRDRDLDSEMIARVPADQEIELGSVAIFSGREWMEATLSSGTSGYVLAPSARGHTTLNEPLHVHGSKTSLSGKGDTAEDAVDLWSSLRRSNVARAVLTTAVIIVVMSALLTLFPQKVLVGIVAGSVEQSVGAVTDDRRVGFGPYSNIVLRTALGRYAVLLDEVGKRLFDEMKGRAVIVSAELTRASFCESISFDNVARPTCVGRVPQIKIQTFGSGLTACVVWAAVFGIITAIVYRFLRQRASRTLSGLAVDIVQSPREPVGALEARYAQRYAAKGQKFGSALFGIIILSAIFSPPPRPAGLPAWMQGALAFNVLLFAMGVILMLLCAGVGYAVGAVRDSSKRSIRS